MTIESLYKKFEKALKRFDDRYEYYVTDIHITPDDMHLKGNVTNDYDSVDFIASFDGNMNITDICSITCQR